MNNRIFIIDDDANVLFTLQSKLSEKGFLVEVSLLNKEVEGILKKIEEHNPGFIILDICYSHFDCIELVNKIRINDFLKKTQIIIYSENKKMKKRSASLGIEYFYAKDDVSVDELIEKVYKIYNNIKK
jgi:DNA-binding NtrC family response regulator